MKKKYKTIAYDIASEINASAHLARLMEEQREAHERMLGIDRTSIVGSLADGSRVEWDSVFQSALGASSCVDSLLEAQRAALDRMLDLRDYLDGSSTIRSLLDDERRQRQKIVGAFHPSIGDFEGEEGWAQELGLQSEIHQRIVESARVDGFLSLPSGLERFRQSDASLASVWSEMTRTSWWESYNLDALNSHTALTNMLEQTTFIDRGSLSAVNSVISETLSGIDTVRRAREFLSITGLLRYPRYRVLTRVERRKRVRLFVKEKAPSPHVRKAHSLIHQYELVLRETIEHCMVRAYGDDWAAQRLPLCECKKLLGKQLADGESVLDHADYFHYAQIMCHDEHFDVAFSQGYESPEALRAIIESLGRLRGRSLHARTFTAQDLRELVVLWRTIAGGWEDLLDEVVIEH